MKFEQWLDDLVEDKNLDMLHIFEYKGPELGMNMIPLGCVIEQIKTFHPKTQQAAKNRLVEIDFKNGDVMQFFGYIAKKMAI